MLDALLTHLSGAPAVRGTLEVSDAVSGMCWDGSAMDGIALTVDGSIWYVYRVVLWFASLFFCNARARFGGFVSEGTRVGECSHVR
jgi:uncharacterized membrane protein